MSQKFKFDGKDYDVANLSDQAKMTFTSLKFVNSRIRELENMQALLQRAKIATLIV